MAKITLTAGEELLKVLPPNNQWLHFGSAAVGQRYLDHMADAIRVIFRFYPEGPPRERGSRISRWQADTTQIRDDGTVITITTARKSRPGREHLADLTEALNFINERLGNGK